MPVPEFFSLTDFEAAASAIRSRTPLKPKVGMVLGSGLNQLADAADEAISVPYGEIPHFPLPTVEGHAGRLVLGWVEGQPVVVMQGRVHYYEGRSMAQITFPVRVMQVLGVDTLIVTNAAGGLNTDFRPGDVMLISDHLNLIGMGGLNPLRGPNIDELGPRFPDMSQAYDPGLRNLVRKVAAEKELPLCEGVYACLAGPSFESPADVRFLRVIGVDAVGMSTVPEVIVARHGGTRVLGLAGISNALPADDGPPMETTHEEVLATGRLLVPRMEAIIRGVLRSL